jgi:hypothetical protein
MLRLILLATLALSEPLEMNRKPGIIEEPSQVPTGENRELYTFITDGLEDVNTDETSDKTQ